MLRVTTSRRRTFQNCQRLHKYIYLDGWQPIEKARPLTVGTAIHSGLAGWLLAKKRGDSSNDILFSAINAVDHSGLGSYDLVLAQEMLTGYHAMWNDTEMEVICIEETFVTDMVDPILGEAHLEAELGGTVDVMVRIDKRDLIMEHKTCSGDFSPGSQYWTRLVLDAQISNYWQGAKALGYEPYGCLYDVLGKPPAIEPKLATPEEKRRYTKEGKLYANQRDTDETLEDYRLRVRDAIMSDPGKYYARAVVPRMRSEIDACMQDTWDVSEEMLRSIARGRHPRNTDACFRFGRACEFFGVCAGTQTLEDGPFKKEETSDPGMRQL